MSVLNSISLQIKTAFFPLILLPFGCSKYHAKQTWFLGSYSLFNKSSAFVWGNLAGVRIFPHLGQFHTISICSAECCGHTRRVRLFPWSSPSQWTLCSFFQLLRSHSLESFLTLFSPILHVQLISKVCSFKFQYTSRILWLSASPVINLFQVTFIPHLNYCNNLLKFFCFHS